MPTGSSPATIGNDGELIGSSEFPWLESFPELNITSRDDELLTSLLKETGWGERKKKEEKDGDSLTLPIEWVVDIADKDGDWFIGTATGYNDERQTLHVMVPDRDAPTWTGDVSVNPLTVRLLECCDSGSVALFKQLVRESAIEVDWDVRIQQRSGQSTRPRGETDPENNDAISSSSEHPSDADGDSSNREAVGDDTRTSAEAAAAAEQDGAEDTALSGEGPPPKAASSMATGTATATATATVTATAKENTKQHVTGTATTGARATLLLPLGNLLVVEVDGCGGKEPAGGASCAFTGDGSKGGSGDDSDGVGTPATVSSDAARRLMRLDDRVEILHCRGTGDPGEEAFYRVAEEGLVSYDPAKIHWRAYTRRAKLRRQDERRRGSLAPSSSSAVEALTAPMGQGGDGGPGGDASLLEGVGNEVRSLARRALELRDDLLTEHLATLRRVRRLVLDGSLEDGAALMEQVDEANVGVLDERSARDKERITMDAESLKSLIFAVADKLKKTQRVATSSADEMTPPPPPPEGAAAREPARTGGTKAQSVVMSPTLNVAVTPNADAANGS